MKTRKWRWVLFLVLGLTGCEKPAIPLLHNHAHNDYEHHRPLFDALHHGFTSVEADIHLVNGQLLVAHDLRATKPDRTLQSLYLDPLRRRAEKYGGHIYPSGDPVFYLLIDTKTESNATYAVLRKVLASYSDILTSFDGANVNNKAVTVVLTGNRPRFALAREKVRYAGLDGLAGDLSKPNPDHFVLWMSENWKHYFKWNGLGKFPPAQKARLLDMVAKAHARHMLVRFWNAPQSPAFWAELRRDGVDLLNADDLAGLEKFLRQN